MIKLYIFPEAFGLRNVGPYCHKIEMAMTYLKLDFQLEILADPRGAPKGKLPYVEIDGEILADSEIILERLDDMSNGGLFGSLSPAEKAMGTAFTRMVEDHLYWMMVASRWLDDAWWPNVARDFFGALPGIVRVVVAPMARKQMRQTYLLQGLGKHTLTEQKQFAVRDLSAINDIVSESAYIVGGRLTVFDFTVVGQLAGLMDNKPATWLSNVAAEFPVLKEYSERVQSEVGVYSRPFTIR
ncbi:MAG: glutathione S-transferase family protein [Pseudomonadales bacterium]|jgi:glutathione S-transferase